MLQYYPFIISFISLDHAPVSVPRGRLCDFLQFMLRVLQIPYAIHGRRLDYDHDGATGLTGARIGVLTYSTLCPRTGTRWRERPGRITLTLTARPSRHGFFCQLNSLRYSSDVPGFRHASTLKRLSVIFQLNDGMDLHVTVS